MIYYRLMRVNLDGSVEETPEFESFEQIVAYMEMGLVGSLKDTNLQYWIDLGWQLEWANINWKMVDPNFKKDEAVESLRRMAAP